MKAAIPTLLIFAACGGSDASYVIGEVDGRSMTVRSSMFQRDDAGTITVVLSDTETACAEHHANVRIAGATYLVLRSDQSVLLMANNASCAIAPTGGYGSVDVHEDGDTVRGSFQAEIITGTTQRDHINGEFEAERCERSGSMPFRCVESL